MKKSLLVCLVLCGRASWATALPDSAPVYAADYTAYEYLDLGAADAGLILDNSNFLSFGDAPGAFLVTANTDFNFTGDQQLLFLDANSPSVTTNQESGMSNVPEPGGFPVAAAVLLAIAGMSHRRKLIEYP